MKSTKSRGTNGAGIKSRRASCNTKSGGTNASSTSPKIEASEAKALLIQKRTKRSVEQKETVDVHIYFNLKTLPGIAGALDVDGDTTIQLHKEAIKDKIAKVESRGYRVSDFYFGEKMEHGYDFVVEF